MRNKSCLQEALGQTDKPAPESEDPRGPKKGEESWGKGPREPRPGHLASEGIRGGQGPRENPRNPPQRGGNGGLCCTKGRPEKNLEETGEKEATARFTQHLSRAHEADKKLGPRRQMYSLSSSL